MECVWASSMLLGEGPLWDARAGKLWCVDILSGRLHALGSDQRRRDTFEVGGTPSFIVPAGDNAFVVGNGSTLQLFDGSQIVSDLAVIDMARNNRLNDATVDCRGRLWFGSMDRGEQEETGGFHVYDAGVLCHAGGRCAISNGPAVNPDGRHIYPVDTLNGTIWRFDISANPTFVDGEVFAKIDPADGTPDGVTLDAEGYLWVCLWGGWAARRYAPDGTLAQVVEFPCANITKIAFGGPDLRTAFATTARTGLDEVALERPPLAGGLFAFSVEVPGFLVPDVRLS